jgi:hypothetical protein
MKVGILVMGAAMVIGSAGYGVAGTVNCKQVNKYLQTGRSVQDVAETMVIDPNDVKKCQEEAAQGGGGEQKGGEQKGGDAGKEMGK